jgi:hypothetical protein
MGSDPDPQGQTTDSHGFPAWAFDSNGARLAPGSSVGGKPPLSLPASPPRALLENLVDRPDNHGIVVVRARLDDRGRPTRVFRFEDVEKTRTAVFVSEMLLHRLHRLFDGVVAPTDRSIVLSGQFGRNKGTSSVSHHPLDLSSQQPSASLHNPIAANWSLPDNGPDCKRARFVNSLHAMA